MITSAPSPAQHPRRARLTGSVQVPPGFEPVLSLFTPRGERLWAEGWDPQFPAPADDDSQPGTVFQTVHGEQSATWVVCDREAGRSIRYARIVHGQNAGTVTVTLDRRADEDGSGSPRVATVRYDLTALTAEAAADLADFAAHYPQFLRHWEQAIAAAVTTA